MYVTKFVRNKKGDAGIQEHNDNPNIISPVGRAGDVYIYTRQQYGQREVVVAGDIAGCRCRQPFGTDPAVAVERERNKKWRCEKMRLKACDAMRLVMTQ